MRYVLHKLFIVFSLSVLLFSGAFFDIRALFAAPTNDGQATYSNSTATPQYRAYTAATNTFGAGASTVLGVAQTFIVNKTSTTRNERIVGYVTTGGVLYILRWNGTTWSAEWSVTVGGNGVDGRRFDIAYENTSGNAMVVYSTNQTGVAGNEMAYRIWNGTAWSAATNINGANFTQAATVTWVKMKANPKTGSNEIALIAADTGTATANTSILDGLIWNGTAWTEAPAALTTATTKFLYNTTGQLVQNDLFDLAYESVTGDLLVAFTTATPQQWYAVKTAAGVWSAAVSYGTGRAAPLQMVAESNPYTDQILVMWNRSGSANVYANVWTGTGVGTNTTVGTNDATTAIEKKRITAKWLRVGATDYAIPLWDTSTAGMIGYNTFTGGVWGTAGAYVTGTGVAANWMDTDIDPQGPDTLMLSFSTGAAGAGSLHARRLVLSAGPTFTWTTPTGSPLVTTLASVTTQNFDFMYTRYVPPPSTTTLGTGADPVANTIAPGSPAADVDAFTLQTAAGTETVSSVTVNLSTASGVGTLSITDSANAVLGSITAPVAGSNVITVTGMSAGTAATTFKVRVTPLSHALMPAVPGGAYAITAPVTAWSGPNTHTGSDTNPNALTIDNLSPGNVTSSSAAAGDTQVVLNWTNPTDTDFHSTVVLRSLSPVADVPAEGVTYAVGNIIGASTVACVVATPATTCTDAGLTNGTAYSYKIFTRDNFANYAAGVVPTGSPVTPAAGITPGDVILLWDGATIPGGWTCVSCAPTDPFFGVFPMGSPTYAGATAGADMVSHTLTYLSATQGAASLQTSLLESTMIRATHTHTWPNPIVGSSDIRPPFQNLQFIKANNPATLPAGAIGIFDVSVASLPAGWTNYTPLNGVYLRGENTIAAGGAATHTHTTSMVTSGPPVEPPDLLDNGAVNVAAAGIAGPTPHTHTILAGNTTADNNAPPFVNVVFAKLGTSGPVPNGLIALFTSATMPTNWSIVSTAGSIYENRLLKGATTFGAVGGVATHNHGGTNSFVSGPPSSIDALGGTDPANLALADEFHTHTVTYTVSTSSSLPVYRGVILGKYSSLTLKSVSGTLISSIFDTAILGGAGFDAIMWRGALGTGGTGKVRFQIATSNATTGPWNYYGGNTCGALDWFDPLLPDTPIELRGVACQAAWNNQRYVRYKVQLCSNDCVTAGYYSPVVNDIVISWAP